MTNYLATFLRHHRLAVSLGVMMSVTTPLVHEAGADPAPVPRLKSTVNGHISAAVQIGDVLYIGGSFSRVSPFDAILGTFYGLSPVTGEPTTPFPAVDGEVTVVEPDSAGGYYIGGKFTAVGGQLRPGLARILADGTLDPLFVPIISALSDPPEVTSIARDGSHVFIVGRFTTVGDQPRSGVAAVDASTGAVAPWVPAWATEQSAVIVAGGRVVTIGSTGGAGVGATALDLASGAVLWQRAVGQTSVFGQPPGAPRVFSQAVVAVAAGNRVIVGGEFRVLPSGSSTPSCVGTLAWLDATTGDIDTTWTPGPLDCGSVESLAVSGDTLYVGGTFTQLGGQTRTNAAAVALATGAVTAWAPEPNGRVRRVATSSTGTVYLGGFFNTVSGQPRDHLAEITASNNVTAWTPNARPAVINDIVASDAAVVIASTTAVSGGSPRRDLAAFDLSTGNLLDWQPLLDSSVTAMAVSNDVVFVAGSFESVSGSARKNLAAIDPASGAVLSWNANAPVAFEPGELVVHGDYLYVTGNFPSYLRRFDRVTAALDTAWAPVLASQPEAMLAHDGFLYVGGGFLTGNIPNVGLVAVDLATGQTLPGGLAVNDRVYALALADTTLFLSGLFTSVGGLPRQHLAAIDIRTATITPWAPTADTPVSTLAIADHAVLVGGPFEALGGLPRHRLGAVTFAGAVTPWTPSFDFPGALVVSETDVTAVANELYLSDVSTFALSGAPRPSSLQATVTDTTVSLTWTAPVGVTPIGYRIDAGTRAGSSNVGSFLVGGTTTSVSTPAPNGTFYVRVRALLSATEPGTEPTNEVVVTVGCAAPPPPPIGFRVELNGAHVSLSWMASAPSARHLLEIGNSIGAADLVVIPIAPGQETVAADAPPGTYFARVRGVNQCGTGRPSAELMFTVGASVPLPAAPTGLSASVNGGVVTLSWTAPPGPVIGHVIDVGSAQGFADLATIAVGVTSSLQVPGVPPGTYFVRVRAITAAGVGPPSADVIVVR